MELIRSVVNAFAGNVPTWLLSLLLPVAVFAYVAHLEYERTTDGKTRIRFRFGNSREPKVRK